jgi:hypothetical protein
LPYPRRGQQEFRGAVSRPPTAENRGNKARMSMKTKDKHKKSLSGWRLGPTGVGVGLALPSSGPAGMPGTASRPPTAENRGNKARMSMKTKDKHKKSRSSWRLGPTGVGVGLALPSSGPAAMPGGGKPSPYGRKSREQSENVYENKGQAQKVAEQLAAGPHRCRGRACPTLVGASRNAGDGKPSPYGRGNSETP